MFDPATVADTATFEKPPAILRPGDRFQLQASGTSSGQLVSGAGPGLLFHYRAGAGIRIEHPVGFEIHISGQKTARISAAFTIPKSGPRELWISAFLWNCTACNVVWVYHRDEPPPSTARKPAASP